MAVLNNKKSKVSDEVPSASMADIAFLLLIFFLVTTTFPKDKGLAIVLPEEAEEIQVSQKNILHIIIQANGIVDLATMHMSLTMSFPLANLLRLNLDRQLEIGEVLLASYLRHFDALPMRKFVLQLSRSLAIRYATSYPKYINYLVGWVKRGLSKHIIAATDKRLSW